MGENKEFGLYLGLNRSWLGRDTERVLKVLKDRYPNAQQEEILDGYWAGVEETTLLLKVVTTEEHLLRTVEQLREIQSDIFVAFDDGNI